MCLGNVYDPWEMFHSTDMGENLEEVVETEDCKVLRMKGPNGDGLNIGQTRICTIIWKL